MSDSPEEVITETEHAWAAGLFDGEGSASTYLPQQRLTRRRQMQVSQGGVVGELPAVLVRFRDVLGGVGGITGPYRGYLYYWKTTRNDVIDDVSKALWPSSVTRNELSSARLLSKSDARSLHATSVRHRASMSAPGRPDSLTAREASTS